jgi:hypothetical protein
MINRKEYDDLVRNVEGYLQTLYDRVDSLEAEVKALKEAKATTKQRAAKGGDNE